MKGSLKQVKSSMLSMIIENYDNETDDDNVISFWYIDTVTS